MKHILKKSSLIHFQNLEIEWNLFSGSNMPRVIIPVKIGPVSIRSKSARPTNTKVDQSFEK